ncbi:HEAT repeat domain-containing protein [Microcoleus sp. MON1_C1]|uniref:HEAT repeat domain-containing protein n=1 Tax=Microcoleus sp. MON1_C1 TaxID=2818827 RepID=UPI002FD01AE1
MIDWFLLWGAAQGVGILVQPILEDLIKDGAKDFAKDFFKDSLKNVLFGEKDPRQVAAGKAIKKFLELVEQPLKSGGVSPEQRKLYIKDVKQFINNKSVKEILGKAFESDRESLDAKLLEQTWTQLDLTPLPARFKWPTIANQYLKAAQEILFDSKDLRDILNDQKLDKIQKNTQETAGIIPDFDLRQYQKALRERYSNLNLSSVDPNTYDYREKLKVWQIFISQDVRSIYESFLPQAYEIPKEHQRRLQDSNQLDAIDLENLEKYRRGYFSQPIVSVSDVIKDKQKYPYIVILGDPGSGKSILLQYLALEWARSPLNSVTSLPITLLIELRIYIRNVESGHCKNFLEFFHKDSGFICDLNQHQLQEQLKAGDAVVMFDGLDEIFDSGKREDVITAIHLFTNEYPRVRVIVTSRIIGYKPQRLQDAGFHHFILQDLNAKQIQEFVRLWHELTFTDAGEKVRISERMERALAYSSTIRDLAGNPLLLTIMAILNRGQELPRDRAELYNQASRVLLYQWDVERSLVEDSRLDPKTIDAKDKQEMLRRVAYQMQAAREGLAGNIISAEDLEEILTAYLKDKDFYLPKERAKLIIHQLRTRNFILCFLGADTYGFVHRTFLEYFCASDVVYRFEKTQKLSLEDLKIEIFGKHWDDESWQEVLCLIAGLIAGEFTGKLIEFLSEQDGEGQKFRNLFLAAKCLDEVRDRKVIAAVESQLLERLKKLTKYDLNDYPFRDKKNINLVRKIRTQAVAAVAATWKDDPETLPWLKQRAQSDDDSAVRRAAVQKLVRGWKDDSETLPLLKQCAQSDHDSVVRRAAVQEIVRGWKDDSETLPWLKQRAQSDDDSAVRKTAVQEIARGWKDDPETLPWLKQRAQSDAKGDVRSSAVQEIARGWKDDPETLPILKQRAQSDDNFAVRYAAVQELVGGWKDDPETLPILKQFAQSDQNWVVRRAAVQKLVEGWKDDPETLPILKEFAQSDAKGDVRKTAVQEIARGWKDDSETLPWLKQRAQSDDNFTVRYAAVQELVGGWKDDPETLPWLKQRAQSDDNWVVRLAAVPELAQGWKDDPETLPILKQRAQSDLNSLVRRAAVQELVRGWKDDPETLPWLKQRAQSDAKGDVRSSAVQEIARGWKDDPETLPILKQCAQSEDDSDVRSSAVREIARGWKDDPETLPWLKQFAQSDDDLAVRRAAVQELVRGWKDDPETLPILKQFAQSDQNWVVRRGAVQELVGGWKENRETLPLFKLLAQSDDNSAVRETAIPELARGWKDHLKTLPRFKKRAQSHYDSAVRSSAVQELVRGWKNDPETLSWLKQCAQSDPNSAVRETAVQELARGWKDELETLLWLKQCALFDDNLALRRAAFQEIARGWKDEPEIFEWLWDIAINHPFEGKSKFQNNPRQTALEIMLQQYPDHPKTLEILRDRFANDRGTQLSLFS